MFLYFRQRVKLCDKQRAGKNRPAVDAQGGGVACVHSSSADKGGDDVARQKVQKRGGQGGKDTVM